jgi:exodeoxyribonuclease III
MTRYSWIRATTSAAALALLSGCAGDDVDVDDAMQRGEALSLGTAALALSDPSDTHTAFHPRVAPRPRAGCGRTLTVMSFNIWGGGANEGKPVDETVAAIQAAGADIIGVQETRLESDPCTAESCPAVGPSAAPAIAEALGYHYYDQTQQNAALWANAVLSRFPIIGATQHDLGVALDVEGRRVYAFNVHFTDFPYQPYQLLGIEYGDAPFLDTAAEAVAAARAARGPALELLFEDLREARAASAAFVFGDFNEPSHHDWTERAVAAGLQPLAVRYPTARAIEHHGFTDALREVFPDEVSKPAFTWTPTTEPNDPEDHHDRIDYVLVRGPGVVVESAVIVGEAAPAADVVVTPWPSDHRAVAASVRLP